MVRKARTKHRLGMRDKPSPEMRETVRNMAMCGIQIKLMERVVGCTQSTLYHHFKEELEVGAVQATAEVAAAMFKAAVEGNVKAQIHWLTTRGRKFYEDPATWTQRVEITGAEGKPLVPELVEDRLEVGRRIAFAMSLAAQEQKLAKQREKPALEGTLESSEEREEVAS